jgi:hypothetical protein
MKQYTIFHALHPEVRTGDCWNNERKGSRLLRISNPKSNSIIVSNRKIDENFIKHYNNSENTKEIKMTDDILILDEHYRKILKVKPQEKVELEIEEVNKYSLLRFKYLHQHPNDSVQIAFWLAFISILISLPDILNKLWALISNVLCTSGSGCT